MMTPPTHSTTPEPMSTRLQNDTFIIRLIRLIDHCDTYYPDPTMVMTPTGTLIPTLSITNFLQQF